MLVAKVNDAKAQYNIGLLYEKGEYGLKKGNKKAYFWLNLAVSNGYLDGKKARDRLAEELGVKFLLEAQEIARQIQTESLEDF